MGVRVRLSRNTSMYLPFWVAIPFWLIWAEVLLCFWLAVATAWLVWGLIAVTTAGIASLSHNQPLAQKMIASTNWKRK